MIRKKASITFRSVGFLICFIGMMEVALLLSKTNVDKKITALMMNAEYLGNEGVVIQTKHNDCGPSALKMIFDQYNIPSTLQEIEEKVELSEKGSSMLALKDAAEMKGLKAEGWRFITQDSLRSFFPLILFVNKEHYVVADSMSEIGDIFIRDPAFGKLRISKQKLHSIWEGETLIFKKYLN
jgi:ABC-type bacteriocin/lantibiotic exporter with double-glycine peptidase domain